VSNILNICPWYSFGKKLLPQIYYVFYGLFSFSFLRFRLRIDVGDLARDASFIFYDHVVRKIAPKICDLLLNMVLLLSFLFLCFFGFSFSCISFL
jgi:O-antigen ligase